MNNQVKNINLEIGDEIGFVILAGNIDAEDNIFYCPVVQVVTLTTGERGYFYQYPDGQTSRRPMPQSELQYKSLRINSQAVVEAEPKTRKICLCDRKDDFKKAVTRGLKNEFKIYEGWDFNTYFVRNETNDTEYKVEFEMIDGKLWSCCECKDFEFKKHICKHMVEVVLEIKFGYQLAV